MAVLVCSKHNRSGMRRSCRGVRNEHVFQPNICMAYNLGGRVQNRIPSSHVLLPFSEEQLAEAIASDRSFCSTRGLSVRVRNERASTFAQPLDHLRCASTGA